MIDVGDAVRQVAIGQRVAVPWAISCGACATCRRGLTSQCERKASRLAAYGVGGRTGGWSGMVSGWDDSPEAFLDRGAAKVVVARAGGFDLLDCSAVEVGAL